MSSFLLFTARILKSQCRLFSSPRIHARPAFPLTPAAVISCHVSWHKHTQLCLPRKYSNLNVVFSPVCRANIQILMSSFLFPRNPRAARVSADAGGGDQRSRDVPGGDEPTGRGGGGTADPVQHPRRSQIRDHFHGPPQCAHAVCSL